MGEPSSTQSAPGGQHAPGTRHLKRAALAVGALVLGTVVVFASVPYLRHGVSVGIGHSAKKLCSSAFVARTDPAQIWKDELERKMLVIGSFMSWQVDGGRSTATVDIFGFGATAVYRPGLGCTLLVERSVEQVLAETIETLPPPRLDPGAPWPVGAASAVAGNPTGIDRAALDAAVDAAFEEPVAGRATRLTNAVMIVHRGRLLTERYRPGFDPDSRLHGWSMSKSITTLLAARLIEMGRLAIDAPANLEALNAVGDARTTITLDHLMRMTPGFEFDERYQPGDDVTEMLYEHSDQVGFAARRPLAHPPGTHWLYSTGTTNLLSRVVQDRSGGTLQSTYEFSQRELFHPLGVTTAVIEPDESGTFIGGAHVHMTPRDWVRFGQLMADDGVWRGRRLLPEGFVDYATTPTPTSGGSYGAGFWLNSPGGASAPPPEYPSLPRDHFMFRGYDGQYIAVQRDRGLVIARFGATAEGDDSGFEALAAATIAAVGG